MKTFKYIVVGTMLGTLMGAGLGVAMPETREVPPAIAIVAVCGAIFGAAMGFGTRLLTRTDAERAEDTQAGELAEAARGRGGIVGGAVIMLVAVVWFGVGLAGGWIYFYPPILFVFGLVSLVRGLLR